MKKYYKIIISLLFISLSAWQLVCAQVANTIPSSPSIANTSVANSDVWTSFHNPASLGYAESINFALGFENRYLLKELSTRSMQLTFPTKLVNVGASFSYFGYSLYHQMLTGVDFSRNFSDKFNLGVGFDYYTLYYSDANRYRGTLLLRLGTTIRLSPTFTLGFSSFNPFQNNIKTEYVTSRIPSVFSLGSEYFFTEIFVWRTQIDKELSSNYRFATGFEYTMLEALRVKLGAYVFDRFVPCIGTTLLLKEFRVDLNCEINPMLGINTMINLRYSLKK